MKQKKRSAFAKNLIAIRKAKGLSQRDLAKISGISHRMLAYYETNTIIPPIDKLVKLSMALDVSISTLLDQEKSDKKLLSLNTRTIKKIMLLEQLSLANQRKVLDYIKALIAQEQLKKNSGN